MEYICKKKCFYKRQLFLAGEKYSTEDADEKVPSHFVERFHYVEPPAPKKPAKEPKTLHELGRRKMDDLLD